MTMRDEEITLWIKDIHHLADRHAVALADLLGEVHQFTVWIENLVEIMNLTLLKKILASATCL